MPPRVADSDRLYLNPRPAPVPKPFADPEAIELWRDERDTQSREGIRKLASSDRPRRALPPPPSPPSKQTRPRASSSAQITMPSPTFPGAFSVTLDSPVDSTSIERWKRGHLAPHREEHRLLGTGSEPDLIIPSIPTPMPSKARRGIRKSASSAQIGSNPPRIEIELPMPGAYDPLWDMGSSLSTLSAESSSSIGEST